ncbi:hypothetical protein [Lacticaseibacillus sp. GG6-2]
MRLTLFDWLILGFAVLAGIALFAIHAVVEAIIVIVLMVVAVFLHRSINNRPGRLS